MATAKKSRARPLLDARPDTLDFREVMFTPTLVEVPTRDQREQLMRTTPRT
jgi:hypothetical protein